MWQPPASIAELYMPLLPFIHRVVARENLSAPAAEQAMFAILDGSSSTARIAAFLVALRMKGETADELLGFARAMRSKAAPIHVGFSSEPLLDTCGTGGDGIATFNISTIAALVVAGAGVRVAKHGNRSISSQCGSADILEALGVNIALNAEQMGRAIREVGIGFLFAPAIHPAMKHAQAARLELKMRTVFNLLGPLTNPAGATAQLAGAPSAWEAELMAKALARLELPRGFVVHGSDGLDEITTTGPTLVYEISGGSVSQHTWTPADFGVETSSLQALIGGGRSRNCEIAAAVLQGEAGPPRDIVLVNAAAALVAAGKATELRHAVSLAAQSIDSGAARRKLEELARFTSSLASSTTGPNG